MQQISKGLQARGTASALIRPAVNSGRPELFPVIMARQSRRITNATNPDFVSSLISVPRVAGKSGGWHPTLIHSSGEVKFTVIRFSPNGGEVPVHKHTHVWDYFMPLSGDAVIETRTKDGVRQDFEMKPGSFLAVPPEDVHRVVNRSEEEFVFFIAQSPREKYDFVASCVDGEILPTSRALLARSAHTTSMPRSPSGR
ncbi:hypothetical protein CERZMDRAFT_83132 [Cercospora zeae-maydis SCOH1-5]|uniref:Cupin type-2 domain-containing protein n=1 Tax=Cercospora zeae-maydis SCOH1-5 TaxID=717836 RepID=A0A6A6FM17_9PEZI|nr:hypothetical protein CERZMDRAFT_83132 [Cercospora zeae-maydis SCOH1-5]